MIHVAVYPRWKNHGNATRRRMRGSAKQTVVVQDGGIILGIPSSSKFGLYMFGAFHGIRLSTSKV